VSETRKEVVPFADMATAIDHNAASSFGGAFVIVPPGGGPVLQTLLLDPSMNPLQFWWMIKQKADEAAQEIENAQRRGAFGR
jgi:hypothetical protein